MLFVDKLKEKDALIRPEFESFFAEIIKNQPHPGELLIWINNGFYNPDVLKFEGKDGKKLNPLVIGPGSIGHSEDAHYRFIHKYRTQYLYEKNFTEYVKLLEWTPERRKEIDGLIEFEETTIQLEMLIYLKFWESDSIIKTFYELTRLVSGETYDWYFKVQESNRDKDATGNRQDLILKHIKPKLKERFPKMWDAINEAYKPQLRNSIAHSNYSFQGRNIHPNNYIENDQYNTIQNVTFDEWIEIFHTLISFHNSYIWLKNKVNRFYAEHALANGNMIEVIVREKEGKEYPICLSYRPEFEDWRFCKV